MASPNEKISHVHSAPEKMMHSEPVNASPKDGRGWLTSFWSCCSPASLCCVAWCLPCITYGKIDHRIRNDGDLEGYSCCNGSCMLFLLASCCSVECIPAAMQRYDLRDKYGIKGNAFVDFMAAWCCTCCVLVQADKEAQCREAQAAQQRALQNRQYQPNNMAMVYPQQPPAPLHPQASGVMDISQAPSPVTAPPPVHTPPYSEKHGN